MKTRFLLLVIAALIAMMGLQSCTDELAPESNYIEKNILCSCESEDHYVYVDLHEAVEIIQQAGNELTWFRIDDAWMENDKLAIKIVTEENETGADRSGRVVLPLSNGRAVRVTVCQSGNSASPSSSPEADKEFIAHWWEMDDFFLGNRPQNNVGTPWTTDRTTCQIPRSITFQNKPSDGWEVVFIDNGMKIDPDRTYFGLYNKWLGKLRIYAYTNATSVSSDYMVRYNVCNNTSAIKYAYHSLPVGIPVDRNIKTNKPTTSLDGITFQNFTIPYTEVGKGLAEGWKAFDIDMSAYSPSNDFFGNDTGLDIAFFPTAHGLFSASGSIDGKSVGTFTDPVAPSMSFNGGAMETVTDVLGTVASVSNDLCKMFTPSKNSTPASEAFKWGGGMFSVAEALLTPLCDAQGTYTFSEGQPGTIELKTELKLKITGEYSQHLAPNQPAVSLRKKAFVHQQPYDNGNVGRKPYIGEGVWSLESTPNYYIVDDVMLGEHGKVRFEPIPGCTTQYYTTTEPKENVRMVSFFDPTSVKVNVNTNLFKNVSKVEVFASPIVVLDQPFGYSDEYYNIIYDKPLERSMPICKGPVTYTSIKAHDDKNNDPVKYYMNIPVTQTDHLTEKTSKIERVFRGDWPFGLRGVINKCENVANKRIMTDPEILYNVNGERCDEGKIPDILISVIVRVYTSDNKMFVYSHRFVPNVVHLKKSQLETYRDRLVGYQAQCNGNKAVDKLNNDKSVEVFHPMGGDFVTHSVNVLNAVTNFKYIH